MGARRLRICSLSDVGASMAALNGAVIWEAFWPIDLVTGGETLPVWDLDSGCRVADSKT